MIGSNVSRYRILAKLGGGGMGVVYEAADSELGRKVAIKFLPEDTSEDPESLERFRREARAASALNHPHICTVYDVGEHDGRPYLVMERMTGQTLKHLLDEGAKLPIERVLRIGEEIADALGAAHRAGIVHRDLKPANLFVTDRDEAKILDFGLAKLELGMDEVSAVGATPRELVEQFTTPGMTVGTVAYMSPEQARGEPADGRSDLFSLGVVLYRMASGRMPFICLSAGEFFRSVLSDAPIPLCQIDPEVPAELEAIIFKCLEKDRDLRYQSAADLRADLKRLLRDSQSGSAVRSASQSLALPVAPRPTRRRFLLAGAAAATAIAVGLGAFWLGRSRPSRPPDAGAAAEKRIAVLPFENLGDPDDAYFADGMADEVQSRLAALPGLAVIARGSTLEYRGSTKRPEVIARELGVDYLLTATVRWQRTGGTSRIRVTPSFVEVGGAGAPVTRWQEAFDAELADIFEVQGRIATEVAKSLEVALGGDIAGRLESSPTSNLTAYDAFLRGRQVYERGWDAATHREAAAQLEGAVALDPEFALAWAHLAISRSMVFSNGGRAPEARDGARIAAERALELGPALPAAYWAMGVYLRLVRGDPEAALDVLHRGLRAAPDDIHLVRNVGLAELERGRASDAIGPLRRAAQLDPRSWPNQLALAYALLRLHRSREAREVTERGLELSPATFDLVQTLVDSHLQEGDLAAAHAVLGALPTEIEPTALVAYFASSNRGWALTAEQRDLLLRLEPGAFGGDRAVWANALAAEHWLRGDREAARLLAEEAAAGFSAQLEEYPDEAILRSELGAALAVVGRGEEAVSAGLRALELAPPESDGLRSNEALHNLSLIYTRLGRREAAIATVERMLDSPYVVTSGWLRIDPNYASLRGDSRFDRLAGGID